MELKDFITQTLEDIVNGVLAAKNNLPESHVNYSRNNVSFGTQVRQVNFNVEIALSKTKEGRGGISVALPFLNTGGEKEKAAVENTKNSLSFSVPVSLPIICGKGETSA